MQCTRKNKYLRKMFQNNALNSLKKQGIAMSGLFTKILMFEN